MRIRESAWLAFVIGFATTSAAADVKLFNIKPSRPGGTCLLVGDKSVGIGECSATDDTQAWMVKTAPTAGYVKLTSNTGHCLDIYNDGKANNRPFVTKCAEASGQLWKLTPYGTGGEQTLTTAWRGDQLCLDVVNETQIILAECRQVAGQRWRFLPAAEPAAVDARMDRDGAGTSARRFSPTFVVVTKPCSLLLPTREPDIQPFTTKNKELAFQCQLDGGNVECSINHTDDLGTRDYMFTAPILKNTSKALQFATPKRLIDVSADVKTGDATVSQRGPNGAVTCDATYVTIETWNKVLREMREKQRASSRNSGGGGYAPAPTTSSPRAEPRPPAPKGSAKGHMCGKNKDCQSGVCAMENKTRGRCQ